MKATVIATGAATKEFGLEEIFLDEMVQGYLDGRNPDNPEPSANRSRSYAHGFANEREDLGRTY